MFELYTVLQKTDLSSDRTREESKRVHLIVSIVMQLMSFGLMISPLCV